MLVFVLAVGVVVSLFAWDGHKGFELSDEGFLWYGAQRVFHGEVPIRDFMAYDPGRYYWSAAFMGLRGDTGIMSVRVAAAAFEAMGLFVGLWLIARAAGPMGGGNILYLLLSAATLAVWMTPYYKTFDTTLSILLIGTLAFLIHSPGVRSYFLAGVCLGVVAVFGRNHGVYGIAGSLGAMLWLQLKRAGGPGLAKGFTLWTAGIAVGFAPVLLMALLVPGFAGAFWESIRFLFEIRATNITVPVPWPWRVNFAALPAGFAVPAVLVGVFFIAVLAFGASSVAWVVWQKLRNRPVPPVLAAAAFLAFPYAHYAYSRADVVHIALGIFPLLLGCLAVLAAQPAGIKWPLSLMLCAASLWTLHQRHPGWQCRDGQACVDVEISGSSLKMDPSAASEVGMFRNLVQRYAADGRSFLAVPYFPGAYALFERRSPTWEIYPLVPRSPEFEQAEIERVKKAGPAFVLESDWPLDRRDEMRFRYTHPLIHRYILDKFDPLPPLLDPVDRAYQAKPP